MVSVYMANRPQEVGQYMAGIKPIHGVSCAIYKITLVYIFQP